MVSQFKEDFKECNEGYGIAADESRHFVRGSWVSLDVNSTCEQGNKHENCHRSWSELDSYPYVGRRKVYPGGGYLFELRGKIVHVGANHACPIKLTNICDWILRSLGIRFELLVLKLSQLLFLFVSLQEVFRPCNRKWTQWKPADGWTSTLALCSWNSL